MALDLAEVTGAKQASEIKKTQEKSPKIANGLDKDAFMKLFLEQLKNKTQPRLWRRRKSSPKPPS